MKSTIPNRVAAFTDAPKEVRPLYELDISGADDHGLGYRLSPAGRLVARVRDALASEPAREPDAPSRPVKVTRQQFAIAVGVAKPRERATLLRWAGSRAVHVEE